MPHGSGLTLAQSAAAGTILLTLFASTLRKFIDWFPELKRTASDESVLTAAQRTASPELVWVETFTQLLDTKFRIPGTNVRFGGDFLMGLVPGLGDVLSMGFSGLLILTMAKNGASLKLVIRMLLNVVLDTVVGSVPVLGNLFDLVFKANTRNLILMREYYVAGKHQGSVWPIVAVVAATLGVLLVITCGLLFLLFSWILKFFSIAGAT